MTARLTAREIVAQVQSGAQSAENVVADALARIVARAALNAVVHRFDDVALERARAIDARRRRGAVLGPLAGAPIAVKDNICTREAPTTCCSKILAGYRPPYDATAVERLLAADAVIVGKTNCDEFGMGSSNETSCFGPVHHPRDPSRSPGGSSGGSAVAVADGQTPAALGSDTGGSVRQPAAFCGVVGVKPTYGRVSRWGLAAHGSSLDQIGPLTRDVRDAALVLGVIAGRDAKDATSAAEPVPDYVAQAETPIDGWKIGHLAHCTELAGVASTVRRAVAAAIDALRAAGALVETVDLPLASSAIPIYYVLATSEASSNLARYDGVRYGVRGRDDAAGLLALYEGARGLGLGAEVKRRILLGAFALSAGYRDAFYARARAARRALTCQLDQLFGRVDLLLLPTAPTPAFRLGEKLDDPLAMYASDVFTVLANLGGHPAISTPAPGPPHELPVGVQLVAPRFAESRLFAAARALENSDFRAH